MSKLEQLLPRHKCSLSLEHNPHKGEYETLGDWLQGRDWIDDDDWVSMGDKLTALENDEVWILQWYPDTPVAFNFIAAATLEGLLWAAQESKE